MNFCSFKVGKGELNMSIHGGDEIIIESREGCDLASLTKTISWQRGKPSGDTLSLYFHYILEKLFLSPLKPYLGYLYSQGSWHLVIVTFLIEVIKRRFFFPWNIFHSLNLKRKVQQFKDRGASSE